MDFIDLKSQYRRISDSVGNRIGQVLNSGQYVLGAEVTELERQLSEYVGVKHCVSASSGTDTLLIALLALDIQPGDEVITVPFTFIATAEMILLAGAKPVFVDIDPRTYNMDPQKLASAITPKTRAIMPVSLYGQCAAMNEINAIAAKHKLPVIEDGAQSFGGTYHGRRSCGLSTIGSTSFFPSKPLGCYGDGGALFTNDERLATLMQQIRVHGQDRRYHHPRLGINGRMDTLQAAVLLSKMEIFADEVAARDRIGRRYTQLIDSAFAKVSNEAHAVATPHVEAHNLSVYAQYTIEVSDRAKVEAGMKARGIPTAVHYPEPLHLQPVFGNLRYSEGDFPHSEKAARHVMSLPMHPYLAEDQQANVVKALFDAVTE